MANAQQLATVIRGPYPGRMIAARRRDPSPVRAEGHIPDHAQHRSAGMGHAQMLAAISAIEDAGNVAAGRAEPAPLWAEGDAGALAAPAPGELLPGSRGPDGSHVIFACRGRERFTRSSWPGIPASGTSAWQTWLVRFTGGSRASGREAGTRVLSARPRSAPAA